VLGSFATGAVTLHGDGLQASHSKIARFQRGTQI